VDDERPTAHEHLDAILRAAEVQRRAPGSEFDPDAAFEPEVVPDAPIVPGTASPKAREIIRAATARAALRRERRRRAQLRALAIASTVALGLGAAALWYFEPGGIEWRPAWTPPAAYVDASAQWALVLTAERIDQFAAANGRLPASLAELDPNAPDIVTYQARSNGDYVLTAPGPVTRRVLDRRRPRAAFLRDADATLRRRIRR